MSFTDKQLNDAEEAVTKLASAINLTDKEIVEVIIDGLVVKYMGPIPDNINPLIDELRATFDAY